VAGAALCLCACFYGLAGAGCLLCVVSLCALVRCAVVAGCAFFNKNKGLHHFFNEKDYMRFYLPINYSIISIMSLPLFDYIDNIMSIISVLFKFKKTPPSKSFGPSFFSKT